MKFVREVNWDRNPENIKLIFSLNNTTTMKTFLNIVMGIYTAICAIPIISQILTLGMCIPFCVAEYWSGVYTSESENFWAYLDYEGYQLAAFPTAANYFICNIATLTVIVTVVGGWVLINKLYPKNESTL